MLTLNIAENGERWDPDKEMFVRAPGGVLMLEHSLLSISKWESETHKAFMSPLEKDAKTADEMLFYIKCMTVNAVDPDIYNSLTKKHIDEISKYISDTHTATTISKRPGLGGGRHSTEIITSEIIYYWMVFHGIPFECQKWHIGRLMTLIQVCNVKESSGKKMSKRDVMAQNRALNAARRSKHHTKG